VHRDVTPQNILVGCDGASRVLDLGVAKAIDSATITRAGHIRGKLGYVAPEYVLGKTIDHRADLYSLSVVLWEMLAGQRLFGSRRDTETIEQVLSGAVPPLKPRAGEPVPAALEEVVRRGLAISPDGRFASAKEMASALHAHLGGISSQDTGEWVSNAAHEVLVDRMQQLAWAENCRLPSVSAAPQDQLARAGRSLAESQERSRENDAEIPVIDREREGSAPIIETSEYTAPEDDDASDLTVPDALFGYDELVAHAPRATLVDSEELITRYMPHSDFEEPSTQSAEGTRQLVISDALGSEPARSPWSNTTPAAIIETPAAETAGKPSSSPPYLLLVAAALGLAALALMARSFVIALPEHGSPLASGASSAPARTANAPQPTPTAATTDSVDSARAAPPPSTTVDSDENAPKDVDSLPLEGPENRRKPSSAKPPSISRAATPKPEAFARPSGSPVTLPRKQATVIERPASKPVPRSKRAIGEDGF